MKTHDMPAKQHGGDGSGQFHPEMLRLSFVLRSTLRGVSRHCPTLHKVWSSQLVTDIVSSIVGISVRPIMDYELGVCNIQVLFSMRSSADCQTCHFTPSRSTGRKGVTAD